MSSKFPSAGLEKRTKSLAIMLTESERLAARRLAQAAGMTDSAYFGLVIIRVLEENDMLPAGYHHNLCRRLKGQEP